MQEIPLLDNGFVHVARLPEHHVVLLVRTAAELPRDEEGLRTYFEQVIESMRLVHKPSHDIVIDGRNAVGRNDELFESLQLEYMPQLFGEFRRIAGVVNTIVGRMQVSRYNLKSKEVQSTLFGTTEDALAWLAETPPDA
ncbi:MAG: hypothetical protein AAGA54_04565 [Myxococcota bacterium]